MEASTPCLCSSSTMRWRHCRPNPFLARYHPPEIKAAIAMTMANRTALMAKRRPNVDRRSCTGAEVGGGSRTGIISLLRDALPISTTVAPNDNRRPTCDQCLAQFHQHDLYLSGLVLDPAQCLAAARAVHDRGHRFIDALSRWLHRLSRPRRRKIFGIYRPDGVDLFSDIDLACTARVHDGAVSDHHARSCFPAPLGQAPPAGALDHADLALRLSYGCNRLFHALPLVPAAESCTSALVDV